MTVQSTSIAAYHDNADDFACMGDRIMAYMTSHYETRTRHEIASALKITTATMSGRINALVRKGKLVEEPGKFRCTVTGNQVRGVSAAS